MTRRPDDHGESEMCVSRLVVFVLIIAAVMFQGILGALIIVPVAASVVVIGRYLHARIFNYDPFPEVTLDEEEPQIVDEAGEHLNAAPGVQSEQS